MDAPATTAHVVIRDGSFWLCRNCGRQWPYPSPLPRDTEPCEARPLRPRTSARASFAASRAMTILGRARHARMGELYRQFRMEGCSAAVAQQRARQALRREFPELAGRLYREIAGDLGVVPRREGLNVTRAQLRARARQRALNELRKQHTEEFSQLFGKALAEMGVR